MVVVGLVESITAVDLAVADAGVVAAVLVDVRRVRGWLDSVEVVAARRLAELAAVSPSMFPERVVADAARVSLTEASKGFDRAKTTTVIPQLAVVLEAGEASAGHVDVVTRAMRPLSAGQRDRFAQRGDVLALAASRLPCDEFARAVRAEIRRVCADDGIDRLQQQRRATGLRSWVDRDTGMWCLHGEFDPETGLTLDARLRAMVETMFHDTTPDTCPTDALLKHQHLRALALVALCNGGGSGRARTEINILIDAATLLHGEHDHSIIDLGIPVDLPIETLRRMACCAEVIVPIITAADGISLHVGRDQRVANRAQRRALRAMYRGCTIPGCTAAWEHCDIHHLHWYRHGGRTDIENLLPLCHKHHHAIHEGGWHLALDTQRNLTITHPDGNTMTTGPPKRTK